MEAIRQPGYRPTRWPAPRASAGPAVTPSALAGNPVRAYMTVCILMKIRVPSAPRHGVAVLAFGLSAVPAAFAQSAASALPETVVTATRTATRVDEQIADVTVLTRQDLERSGYTSLNEVLVTIPGVQAVPDSVRGANPSVFIRGANNAHTLVLLDGQRISSATTGATALAHLPLEQIDRIEILRGPASSLYGSDAIGGVIQIFTRRGQGAPRASVSVTAGTFGTVIASAGYGGRLGDTRFNVQVGVDHTHGFSNVSQGSGFYSAFNADRDGYHQRNLGLNVSRKVSGDLELGAAYFYSEGRKRNDSSNCSRLDYNDVNYQCTPDYDNHDKQRLQSIAVHGTYQVRPGWNSTLRLGVSEDVLRYWALDPTGPTETQDLYRTRQPQVSWQNDIRLGEGVLMAALDWRRITAASPVAFTVNEQQTWSASLGYQAWIGRHLLQASARHDDVEHLGAKNTGTVGYGYKVAEGWVVRASAGTGFRAPSFNDLYWPYDSVNHYEGNPNLRPERSRNLEAGIAYERDVTRLSLTAYRNRVVDLIDYPYDAGTDFTSVANSSSATLKGVTLVASSRIRDWTLSGSYDVLSARDDSTGRYLQRRVPRSATLDLSRRFGAMELGARVQAFSNRFNDSYNTSINAGYGLLSLRAAYSPIRDWTLSASVQNALDKSYVVQRSGKNVFATAGRAIYVGVRYTGL